MNTTSTHRPELLDEVLAGAHDFLTQFAQDEVSLDKVSSIYGTNFDTQKLSELLQQWSNQDFSALPELVTLKSTDLSGARGAYSKETNTIYLSTEFLNSHSINDMTGVVLEEIGHFVDARINQLDTSGDEGAVFSRVVRGMSISDLELQQLRIEDDGITVTVNGQTFKAEADTTPESNLSLLSSSIKPLLDKIRNSIAGQSLAKLPLLGDVPLQKYIDDFLTNSVEKRILDELDKLTDKTNGAVRNALFDALKPESQGGLGLLLDLDNNGKIDINDISNPTDASSIAYQFKIGKSFNPDIALSKNFGLPNLGFNLIGGVTPTLDFALNVGFGVDNTAGADAFFFDTSATDELQVELKANLKDKSANPLELKGSLGFLQIGATDNGSALNSKFALDLTNTATPRVKLSKFNDITLGSGPKLTANADLKLKLDTGLDKNGNLPSITADFNLTNWNLDSLVPNVEFQNVALDLGSFANKFVGPTLKDIQRITGPIEDILTPVITPIPVIDYTLLELAETFRPDLVKPGTNEFVEQITESIKQFNNLPSGTDGIKISLGSFNTNPNNSNPTPQSAPQPLSLNSILPADAPEAPNSFVDTLKKLEEEDGLKFPLLTDPSKAFNLLLGQNVTLFEYNPPGLQFEANIGKGIIPPIPVFGPVVIQIYAKAGASAQFGFGYDAQGLIDFTKNNFQNPADLTNGFFLSKPDNKGYLTIFGEIGATAGVDLSVASLEVGGGLRATVELGKTSPSKVRGSALADDPLCLFAPSGNLALIIFGSVTLDLGFFNFTRRLDLANINLLDFSTGCDPNDKHFNVEDPTPDPATEEFLKDQGVINRKGTENGETITVKYLSGNKKDGNESVLLLGLDFPEGKAPGKQYDNLKAIVIDGLGGNDTITLTDGVDVFAQLDGGTGDDIIVGAAGNDYLTGGAGNDSLDGKGGTNTVSYADAPKGATVNLTTNKATKDGYGTSDTLLNIQNVEGSQYRDIITGNSQKNFIDAGDGNDDIFAGGDDDVLLGGAGRDLLNGGEGVDTTTYLTSPGGVNVNLRTGVAFGGDAEGDKLTSVENVHATVFDDVLVGNSSDNSLGGYDGDDKLEGGAGADLLDGGAGNDTAIYRNSSSGVDVSLKTGKGDGGDAEDDKLVKVKILDADNKPVDSEYNTIENLIGSNFNDTLEGDKGNNKLEGLAGSDTIKGDNGDDILIGGAGADSLDGGTGIDWADYSDSPGAVNVNLQSVGSGSDAQGDTFINAAPQVSTVENLRGSDFGDTLVADNGFNVIDPDLSSGGTDNANGGGNKDTLIVDYSIRDTGTGITGGYLLGSATSGAFSRLTTPGGAILDAVNFTNIERLIVKGTIKDDLVIAGTGDDIVITSDGNDTIYGGRGSNLILAGDGDDTVVDQNDVNLEFKTIPNNTVTYLDGGRGIDSVSIDLSGKFVQTQTGILQYNLALISTNPLVENPTQALILSDGTAITNFEIFKDIKTAGGNDTLIQQGRVNNNFSTGEGNDYVNAGLGIDVLDGGQDPDVIVIKSAPIEAQDVPTLTSDTSEVLGNLTQQVNLDDNPVITPKPIANQIEDDLLVIDYSVEDNGTGIIAEIAGFNAINGGRYYRNTSDGSQIFDEAKFTNFERFNITGTSKNDRIFGGDLNDVLSGNAGDDFIIGNAGNDQIQAGEGKDIVVAGSGNDTVNGGDGDDIIVDGGNFNPSGVNVAAVNQGTTIAGGGNDIFDGGKGNDAINGGIGDDQLNGGDDNDFLVGGEGSDTLKGESGNDTLIGINYGSVVTAQNNEIDTLTGGTGADQFWLGDGTFVYYDDGARTSPGRNTYASITDFNSTEGDIIQLNGQKEDYFIQIVNNSIEIYRKDAPLVEPGDLIGIVQGLNNFDLGASYVRYVDGSEPNISPNQAFNLNSLNLGLDQNQNQNLVPQVALVQPLAQTRVITSIQPLTASLTPASGDFTITQNGDGNQLLNQLLGNNTQGLSNFKVKLKGDSRAFGTFQNDPFGLSSGIVLSTGRVTDLVGKNISDGDFSPGTSVALKFDKLDGLTGSSSNAGTAIYRADLSNLGFDLKSLTIGDGGIIGGSDGRFTGFDLDGIKLSTTKITNAADIQSLPSLNVFDFSPVSTIFTPGTQRPPSDAENPDLFGTINGNVNNGIANLGSFDAVSTTGSDANGFVSLGNLGKTGFNLTKAISSQQPLYLYVGEVGDNGEVVGGNITASNREVKGLNDLSQDFGLPGATDDSISMEVEFDADAKTKYVFFQFAFGSEEFAEYAGKFNDAFSLELNGFNMARLSDGDTVTINNLAKNAFASSYHPDFIYNPVDTGPASSITKLDGYTKPLTFVGVVEPNTKNKLVINVKDNRDGLLDSAVFLKAGTFGITAPKPLDGSKPGVDIESEDGKDTIIITEGGEEGTINISLDTIPSEDVTVTVQPGAGVDLGNGPGKPVVIIFTPTDSNIPHTLPVSTPDDGKTEGTQTETITITATSNDPNYNGINIPPVKIQVNDPTGTGGTDSQTGVSQTANDLLLVSGQGSQVGLEFALLQNNAGFVNEVGVFVVDNEKGEINGIAPGQNGYLQAAMQRKQVLLSALTNNPSPGFNSARLLSFASNSYLNFYLVQDGSTDEVLTNLADGNPTPNVFFATNPANVDSFDHLLFSNLTNGVSLAWEDSSGGGDKDFDDLVIKVSTSTQPLTVGSKLQAQREIIDLRDYNSPVSAQFIVYSEASYNNHVGFYTIDDVAGRIGNLLPTDAGYAQAALQRRVASFDRNATDVTGQFNGGALFAPFIIANGSIEEFLNQNPNNLGGNAPIAYFAYSNANPDKIDHARLLGDNKFGFEDLFGKGDGDYNDIVLQVNFKVPASIQAASPLDAPVNSAGGMSSMSSILQDPFASTKKPEINNMISQNKS